MIVIGIDNGTKRIGLASSDEDGRVAFAAGVIDARKGIRAQLEETLKLHAAGEFVIGNPMDCSGGPGKMTAKTVKLAAKIEKWFGKKCVLWDERFTTVQAGTSPLPFKNAGDADQAAAVIILQSYLDFKNSHKP